MIYEVKFDLKENYLEYFEISLQSVCQNYVSGNLCDA